MTKNLSLPFSAVIMVTLMAFLMVALVGLPAHAQTTTKVEYCTLVEDLGPDLKDDKGDPFKKGNTVGPQSTAPVPGTTHQESNDWSLICLLNTVNVLTNWVFILLLALAIGLIALGGFLWMASGADASQKARATTMIQAAVVGFVIAILARFIPGLIQGLLF